MIAVKVLAPAGRNIYVDENYQEPEGLAPLSIVCDDGDHTFETVSFGKVDFRGKVVDATNGDNLSLRLDPVDPPEPV